MNEKKGIEQLNTELEKSLSPVDERIARIKSSLTDTEVLISTLGQKNTSPDGESFMALVNRLSINNSTSAPSGAQSRKKKKALFDLSRALNGSESA